MIFVEKRVSADDSFTQEELDDSQPLLVNTTPVVNVEIGLIFVESRVVGKESS